MATSEQSPSAALLRLRAADVVRVCGLNAAAVGLELAANHRVVASQRDSSRLLATVVDGSPYTVSVEFTDEADAMRWACDCAHAGPLACEHVAATLSAWIAHPSDFLVKGSERSADMAPESPAERASDQPRASDIVLPHLTIFAPETLTLAGTLGRMSATDVDVIARRILGADMPGDTSD